MADLKVFSVVIAWDDNDSEQGDFGDFVRAANAEEAEAKLREKMREHDRNEYGYTEEELAEREYGSVIECHEGAIWKAVELETALRGLLAVSDEIAGRMGWADHGERATAKALIAEIDGL